MAQREKRQLTKEEIEEFQKAIEDLEDRTAEFLTKDLDRTSEELKEDVKNYPMPDPEDVDLKE